MGRKAVSYLLYILAIAFTVLLLVAAVLSWRASFISPEQGEYWSTLALLLPVILLANAVALVWWIVRRKWIVALIPLSALVFNLGFISAMIQLPDIGDGSGKYDFRIGTLNVGGFRHLGTPAGSIYGITRLAKEEHLDILCMQEFHADHRVDADSIATLFSFRLPYFVSGAGQAIASRFPILNSRYVRFPATNNDYLVADLKIGDDTVRIFSVHLQTSGISSLRRRYRKDYDQDIPVDTMFGELERNSRLRAQQVNEIRSAIDSTRYPVIVAGDFNDMPSSYVYRRMKGDLTDGFQASGNGYGSTFRYLGGLLRIDYIFYDGDAFEGVGYYTPSEDVSDHKAVVAGLRLRR